MSLRSRAHEPRLLSPRAVTTEATRSRAHRLQLLSPHSAATEACEPRARAPQQEKPPQWEAHAPQRRVAPRAATRESPRA